MEKIRIEYDKSWKEVVTHLFRPFIEFFLTDLHEQVNWDVPPEFLEKELHNAKNIKKPKRIVDKLVKVQLKNGEEKWIFIHIEFQTDGEKIIGLRMYEYYQLIRERYGKEVVAIVIYTGDTVPKLPNIYKQTFFGTSITYEFNSYAVIEQKEESLLNEKNPFALVVLANHYVQKTKGNQEQRYEFKQKLYELAQNRNYDLEELSKILIFVSELMKLSPKFEKKFEKEVVLSKFKNNSDMIQVSQTTKNLVNAYNKELYGETMEEAKAKAKEEIKQIDEKLTKSIILLYTRVDMSIEEIAEHLSLENEVVKRILIQKKIIKK
jgi:hypothetical protein